MDETGDNGDQGEKKFAVDPAVLASALLGAYLPLEDGQGPAEGSRPVVLVTPARSRRHSEVEVFYFG